MLTFALTKTLPGDPVLSLVGERAKPEVIEQIQKELKTDRHYKRAQYRDTSYLFHALISIRSPSTSK
jgi:ABC-type dipeptide/oligopeptide/nickel transport system permease component